MTVEPTIKQEQIIYKNETRVVSVPYCPLCNTELRETSKEYKPYYCKCGFWYWNDEEEYFKIIK